MTKVPALVHVIPLALTVTFNANIKKFLENHSIFTNQPTFKLSFPGQWSSISFLCGENSIES